MSRYPQQYASQTSSNAQAIIESQKHIMASLNVLNSKLDKISGMLSELYNLSDARTEQITRLVYSIDCKIAESYKKNVDNDKLKVIMKNNLNKEVQYY